jgi:hypothetical protein
MVARRRGFAPQVLIPLLLLILLAFFLRLHQLDAFSFWTDEGLTPARAGYAISQILRNEIVIQGFVSKDTHPPLYYLIIHLTSRLFGVSDFAYRFPSVLFGVLLVPLLYQFGRRLERAEFGLLVALLVAVNPLQVYYSQEARMYTLLVLLGAAASYVLWRALSDPALTGRRLALYAGLYAVLAGLTVYTHYTAAFLIAIQALFWAWLLWRRGLKWVIIGGVVVAALAAVPLIPYTVPRLFTGTEANYTYVSPLVMLQDVVHFFNQGVTTDFSRWSVRALDILAFILLLLGAVAARPWLKRSFLLSYLLAVVLGLMAGSLIKPMYQGVRHIMLGSPAFLLLAGYGIWWLWHWLPLSRATADTDPDQASLRASPLGILALSLVLLGSTAALLNLYRDPAYAKDDFRAMINFIEQRAGDNDVIVYNNAVLLPLHEHYRVRPDIDATALPVYPQIATGEEPELAALAEQYDHVWFITDPPADRRDDGQLIQGWLDANLTESVNRLFPARTTVARVLGYTTGERHPDRLPDDALSLNVPFSDGLSLAGVALPSPQPLALPTLWLNTYWDGVPQVGERVRLALVGADGREWLVRSHPLIRDEDEGWSTESLNRTSYDLPLPPGLPPGDYTLTAQPEDATGAPLAEAQPLTELTIAGTEAWPAPAERLYSAAELDEIDLNTPAVRFAGGLLLQAAVAWDANVRPGNNLPFTLYWQAGDTAVDTEGLTYTVQVIAPDGSVAREQSGHPGASWLTEIPAGALVREVTSLYFAPDTPTGQYKLRWQLQQDGEVIEGRPPLVPWNTAFAQSGTVNVVPWPLVSQVPPVAIPLDARFGEAIRLVGATIDPPADNALPVTLVWQAEASPTADYLAFVHLVSDETGEIISQIDRVPVDGLRPTSGWRAGEVLVDTYALPLPDDLPPGTYHVNVGLYDPDDGARPEVTMGGVAQPDNQLPVGNVELSPGE